MAVGLTSTSASHARQSFPLNQNIPGSGMPARSMVGTCLFESNNLLREGLKSFLAGTEFLVKGEFDCISKYDGLNTHDVPDLIIIGVQKPHEAQSGTFFEEFTQRLHQIRGISPNVKVVLLASVEDISDMPAIVHCNADGYLLRNTSREAILGYLNLAMMGEKTVPEAVAHLFAPRRGEPMPCLPLSAVTGPYNLSERENDIAQCLVLGESNKLIARHLEIAESTVKVHLKTILRKMGVQNRTQAALLVVNQAENLSPGPELTRADS